MEFWLVVVASIVLVFVWGLIAPRSQWKTLAAWSYRDPRKDEPSGLAFGIQRTLSGAGVLFFGFVGFAGLGEHLASLPPEPVALTSLQQMWGAAPAPQVVNRIVQGAFAPPTGLVERPIEGYQVVNNEENEPRYLHLLNKFAPQQNLAGSGMIGTEPGRGFTALDSAELVVNVRAWVGCIPRQAVVIETDTTVKLAVYYGLPNAADGTAADPAECNRPPFVQKSALLPIDLAEPLGARELQTLDGVPIREVLPIEK